MEEENISDRPLGITILAIWLIATTILSIILYYFEIFETNNQFLTATLSIILNIIGLIIAYGLLKGFKWGWTSAIILAVFGSVFSILNNMFNFGIVIYFIGFNIIGFLIVILVIYYLTRPNVKAYFFK